MRLFFLLVLLAAVLCPAWATLTAARRVSTLAAANCFAATDTDIWEELEELLGNVDPAVFTNSLYALGGALRSGRSVCGALVSAAGIQFYPQRAVQQCESRLGPVRGRKHFLATDDLILCLKSAQKSVILALVQSPIDEEMARLANLADVNTTATPIV